MAVNEAPERVRGKGAGPAKLKLPAPTLEYILKLREDGKRIYGAQDEQIRTMRQVRELLDPPPSEMADWRVVSVEVKAPIATDNIQRTAATLSVNPPELQCIPAGEGLQQQENATKRERCTMAIVEQAGERESSPPCYQMAIDSAVADGGAWTKVLLTDDGWDEVFRLTMDEFEDDPDPEPEPGEEPTNYARRLAGKDTKEKKYNRARAEEKKKARLPISWVQVDAATVYPFYGGLGTIREVLEVTRRPMSTTMREYRLKRGRDGRLLKASARDNSPAGAVFPEELAEGVSVDDTDDESGGLTCEFLEHWDDTYVTYAIVDAKTGANGTPSGIVLDQWRHGYGRQPYFFAPGIWMNHWKNRKVGWGVSESMKWLVKYLGFLLTVHANLAARDAFVPLQEEVEEMAAPILGQRDRPVAGTPQAEKWQLGRIYRNAPGRKLSPITFPQVAEQLKEQIKLVMDLIEQLITPRVSSQIGGNMEGAGFAISQVLAEGRIRHDPIAQGIERMLKGVTEFIWHLIRDVLKEDVWVYADTGDTADWDTLGGEDLDAAVKIIWTVNAETPSAELLKARYWGERLANFTANRDMAIEGMGDNPDEVYIGLTIDRIRETDAYKAWMESLVFSRAERGDILAKLAGTMADQMLKTGVVPGPGGANPADVPDIGALAQPGSANTVPGPMATTGGVSPGATNPQMAAQAQVQNLGGPGT